MRRQLVSASAGLALLAGATNAFAGSVLQPGGTVGLPAGAPLAEGVYFIDTSSYGVRTSTPSGLEVNLTQVVWATPFSFYDTRLQFILLQPTAAAPNSANSALYANSTLGAAQLAHTFGNGFNLSYQAGYRTAEPAGPAFHAGSFEQRGAFTYNALGFDLTANVINGLFYGRTGTTTYPNWLNVDLTATKKFDKLEIGAVAFGSGDTSMPTPTYLKQRQIAVGGLFRPLHAAALRNTRRQPASLYGLRHPRLGSPHRAPLQGAAATAGAAAGALLSGASAPMLLSGPPAGAGASAHRRMRSNCRIIHASHDMNDCGSRQACKCSALQALS